MMQLGTIHRFRLLALVALLALVMTAAVLPQARAQQDRVGFAYFPAFHTMSVMLAAEGGFFERHGLQVDMLRTASGALLIPTLLSGDAQLTTGNLSNIARLRAEGRELLFIYPVVGRMSLNTVVRQETLDRLGVSPDDPIEDRYAALCQMTIGYTTPNSPTDVFTRYFMRAGGCDPARANLVSIGGQGELLAAMRSGRIDGFMLTPPSPNLAVLEGFGVMFIKPTDGEIPELDNYPYTGIIVSRQFAEANPETVISFIAALLEASAFAQEHPDEAVDLLSPFFPDMDPDVLQAGFDDMRPALPDTGLLTEEYVENYLTIDFELGILEGNIPRPTEEGTLWTNDYTREALERIGR